jgi:hypothetical protein
MESILNDLSKEAIEKVEKSLLNYEIPLELTKEKSDSIKIGPTSRKPKRRIPVQIRGTDHLGPAPYPEGYHEHLQKPKKTTITSYQEQRRQALDAREYVPTKKAPVLRAGGGEVWKDESMSLWDENDYRLFVGDLGREVSDELLTRAFSNYPSVLRCHVVRDNKSGKSKGFGFVSFANADDYVKAMREMNGIVF